MPQPVLGELAVGADVLEAQDGVAVDLARAMAQAMGEDGYEATGLACKVYDAINGRK